MGIFTSAANLETMTFQRAFSVALSEVLYSLNEREAALNTYITKWPLGIPSYPDADDLAARILHGVKRYHGGQSPPEYDTASDSPYYSLWESIIAPKTPLWDGSGLNPHPLTSGLATPNAYHPSVRPDTGQQYKSNGSTIYATIPHVLNYLLVRPEAHYCYDVSPYNAVVDTNNVLFNKMLYMASGYFQPRAREEMLGVLVDIQTFIAGMQHISVPREGDGANALQMSGTTRKRLDYFTSGAGGKTVLDRYQRLLASGLFPNQSHVVEGTGSDPGTIEDTDTTIKVSTWTAYSAWGVGDYIMIDHGSNMEVMKITEKPTAEGDGPPYIFGVSRGELDTVAAEHSTYYTDEDYPYPLSSSLVVEDRWIDGWDSETGTQYLQVAYKFNTLSECENGLEAYVLDDYSNTAYLGALKPFSNQIVAALWLKYMSKFIGVFDGPETVVDSFGNEIDLASAYDNATDSVYFEEFTVTSPSTLNYTLKRDAAYNPYAPVWAPPFGSATLNGYGAPEASCYLYELRMVIDPGAFTFDAMF